MNKYFTAPGDLEPKQETDKNVSKYFYRGTDLTQPNQTNTSGEETHIETQNQQSGINKYFTVPGDLEQANPTNTSGGEIMYETGSMIVTKEKLDEMVKNGYEIEQIEELGNNLFGVVFETTQRSRKGR